MLIASFLSHFQEEKGSFDKNIVILQKEEGKHDELLNKVKDIIADDSGVSNAKAGKLIKEA